MAGAGFIPAGSMAASMAATSAPSKPSNTQTELDYMRKPGFFVQIPRDNIAMWEHHFWLYRPSLVGIGDWSFGVEYTVPTGRVVVITDYKFCASKPMTNDFAVDLPAMSLFRRGIAFRLTINGASAYDIGHHANGANVPPQAGLFLLNENHVQNPPFAVVAREGQRIGANYTITFLGMPAGTVIENMACVCKGFITDSVTYQTATQGVR